MKRFVAILMVMALLFVAVPAWAGKKVDDTVLDAALDVLDNGTHITFCSAEPANYAGIAAVTLISVTITAGAGTDGCGSGTEDYDKTDGDTSGRKLTVCAQTGLTPGSNGTVTHACLDDGSTLLGCTTVTSQAVTTSQTWDSPAFDFEIQDPQ